VTALAQALNNAGLRGSFHFYKCAAKLRFGSYLAALKTADRRAVAVGTKIFVYRCPSCGGYHLTKNEQD
jgi:hypothetical protein